MSSAQGDRQAAVRALTGTTLDYNGDWSALFDQAAIPQLGGWNGRLLAWLNLALGASYTNVNDAMAAYAVASGSTNWSSVNSLVAGGGYPYPPPPGFRWQLETYNGDVVTYGGQPSYYLEGIYS